MGASEITFIARWTWTRKFVKMIVLIKSQMTWVILGP